MTGLIIHIIDDGKTIGYFGHWLDSGVPHLFPFAHNARIFITPSMARRHAKWVEIMGRRTSAMGKNAHAKLERHE
jgi:hypothetical protein